MNSGQPPLPPSGGDLQPAPEALSSILHRHARRRPGWWHGRLSPTRHGLWSGSLMLVAARQAPRWKAEERAPCSGLCQDSPGRRPNRPAPTNLASNRFGAALTSHLFQAAILCRPRARWRYTREGSANRQQTRCLQRQRPPPN